MKLAPIVLFVYNRTGHTEQTINALKKNELADQSDLIIYSDGPKADNDTEPVNSVRQYLKKINGFKTVTIIERDNNWGLAANIIDGVTEIVNKFGRIIVLEDDLVAKPIFLRYMNQALEKYEDKEKVMQISGHMFDVNVDAETDAVFLQFTTSWGWATWKRAWEHFDPHMSGYETLKKDKDIQLRFNLEGSYNYFKILKAQFNRRLDSWAIRWYLSVFVLNGLTLYPTRSLIKNIGFDGSGTHCGDEGSGQVSHSSNSKKQPDRIQFPEVELNKNTYDKVTKYFKSQRTFKKKLMKLINGL